MKKIKVDYLLSILYIIAVITPYTARNNINVITIFALSWIFFVFIKGILRKNKNKVINKIYFITIIWVFYIFTLKVIGYSTAEWGNYLIQGLYWLPIIIFTYYYRRKDYKHLRVMSLLIIILVIINSIDNIRLNDLYPNIITVITSSQFSQYWNLNFANTAFVFVSVIVLLILILYFFEIKGIFKKMILILLCLIIFNFIFISSRTTAFIMLLITSTCLVLTNVVRKFSQRKRIIIFITSFIILIVFGYIFINNINYFVSLINNKRIEVRILAMFGEEGGLSESLLRIDLAKMSIYTWLKNPINFLIGIGYHQKANPFDVGVGQHSGFIDLLAYYGIFGISVVIYLYYIFYKMVLNDISNDKIKTYIKIIIIMIMVYNIANNFYTMEIGLAMFILLPSLEIIFSKKEIK
ncbi:MAG: hypothetical protein E7D30_09130 [Clostridium perfringens]|nr:hypothetical protein [Clostridium perfringens]MDU2516339.1 hypothetical protein [Clostridium perfringens]